VLVVFDYFLYGTTPLSHTKYLPGIIITLHVDMSTYLVHHDTVFRMSQLVCDFTPIHFGFFADLPFLILPLGSIKKLSYPSHFHLTIVMSIHIFKVSIYVPTSTIKLVLLSPTTNNRRAVVTHKTSPIIGKLRKLKPGHIQEIL